MPRIPLTAGQIKKCLDVMDLNIPTGYTVVHGTVGDNYINNKQWSFVRKGGYCEIVNKKMQRERTI